MFADGEDGLGLGFPPVHEEAAEWVAEEIARIARAAL
jgi:hypothetical protein